MALSKSMVELQDMQRYFNMPQFLQNASLDPFSLYSTMGRVLATLTRARHAARIEKIQLDSVWNQPAFARRRSRHIRAHYQQNPGVPYPSPLYRTAIPPFDPPPYPGLMHMPAPAPLRIPQDIEEEIDIEVVEGSPTEKTSPSENRAKKATKRCLADIAADLHAKKAKESDSQIDKGRNKNILKVLQSKPSPIQSLPSTFPTPNLNELLVKRAVNPNAPVDKTTVNLGAGISVVTTPEDDRKIKIGRPPKNSMPCGQDSNGSFSRHNDMVYYPNIQCLLCEEWVCSRNRYMHIESHLQYKPYKCSLCGYDNRKEIFITLHIRRVHGGNGEVIYTPDAELEKKAWNIAEECLQHTRQLLITQNSEPQNTPQRSPTEKLAEFSDVYRAKISNTQRAEKTQLIEESRQLGIFPGLRSLIEREVKCEVCGAFVIRSQPVTEEHVRSHLQVPSYACIVPGCETAHTSRLFMLRHMKEVHKLRKSPDDLMTWNRPLLDQFLAACQRCFPTVFTQEALDRIEVKFSTESADPVSPADRFVSPLIENAFNQSCLSCQVGLSLRPGEACINCTTAKGQPIRSRCNLCSMELHDDVFTLLRHAISHLRPLPFSCSHCSYSHWAPLEVDRHNLSNHTTVLSRVTLNYDKTEIVGYFYACVRDCFGSDFLGRWVRNKV